MQEELQRLSKGSKDPGFERLMGEKKNMEREVRALTRKPPTNNMIRICGCCRAMQPAWAYDSHPLAAAGNDHRPCGEGASVVRPTQPSSSAAE